MQLLGDSILLNHIFYEEPNCMMKQLLRLFGQRTHHSKTLGKQSFPHLVKQRILQHYLQTRGIHTLLEINTFPGLSTPDKAPEDRFIAAEISENLFQAQSKKPLTRASVEMLWGASRKVLQQLNEHIQQPVICWLDGHYNGFHEKICPIFEQLDVFFATAKRHVFLINNAARFNGEDGWPAIEAVVAFLKNKDCRYRISIHDNVIVAAVGE